MFTWIFSYQCPGAVNVIGMAIVREETVILHDYASTAGSRILSFETFR